MIQNVSDTSFVYVKHRTGQSPLVVQVPAGQDTVDWAQVRLIAAEARVAIDEFADELEAHRYGEDADH